MEAPGRLLEIGATPFRSLVDVDVPLGPLNVLVGPNNSGKSNLLDVIRFLSDSVHTDLRPALDQRGGFERVRFRDGNGKGAVSIRVKAVVTRHSSSNAPDEYALTFDQRQQRGDVRVLTREESSRFKRYRGPGRRITVEGQRVEFADEAAGGARARGASACVPTPSGCPRFRASTRSRAGPRCAVWPSSSRPSACSTSTSPRHGVPAR